MSSGTRVCRWEGSLLRMGAIISSHLWLLIRGPTTATDLREPHLMAWWVGGLSESNKQSRLFVTDFGRVRGKRNFLGWQYCKKYNRWKSTVLKPNRSHSFHHQVNDKRRQPSFWHLFAANGYKKDMAEWRIFPQFPFLLGVRVTWRQSQLAWTGGRKEDLLSPLPYTLTKTGHKNFALNRSTESILSGRELASGHHDYKVSLSFSARLW